MGLSSSDKKPANISLQGAYSKIQKWYQSKVALVRSRADAYTQRSVALIEALPPVTQLSALEIRAVLGEVLYGHLEWAYHQDDGAYKMAAYAQGALETAGLPLSLSESEKADLKKSPLWPHLSLSRS